MINVSAARAALDAQPGDHVVYTKAQMAQLLDEVDSGQHARRKLADFIATTGAGLIGSAMIANLGSAS